MNNANLQRLAALAHPEGGWGYAPDQRPFVEPTCLALLALAGGQGTDAPRSPVVELGLNCLRGFRRPDASYRLDRGREEAVWGTAISVITLLELGVPESELSATGSFLLGVRGKAGQEDPDADMAFDIDIKLIGWPWAEGTFSWVEPTSWACLALTKLGQHGHPRVQEGFRLLLDRAFDHGGANYGNKLVLSKETEPIPGPSAILLIALQHHSAEPRVQASLDYIAKHAVTTDDLEHLGQASLALELHGRDPALIMKRLDDALARRGERTWAELSPAKLAWAILGLNAKNYHPLRMAKTDTLLLPETPLVRFRPPVGERIVSKFRGILTRGMDRLRTPPPRSVVSIEKADDYNGDLASVVRRQYEAFREMVPIAGRRVVLKPNLVEYHRDKVINTDPRVVAAVIEMCQKEGASEVIVAEGPGHWRNVEYLVAESGLGDVLTRTGCKFVDLNHDEPMKLANLGLLTGLENLYIARTVATADVLISLPKLKTHHWAGATLSLKNLFGTLPGTCYGWPKNELHWRGIAESIIDIALTCTPHLAIIDGIVGMEGDGPLNGTARPVGALIMGNDLVATDATGCRLMGLPPEKIVHIALGVHKRLGRINAAEIEMLGTPIAELTHHFERPPRWDKITLAG